MTYLHPISTALLATDSSISSELNWRFDNLAVEMETADRTLWCRLNPLVRPSFTSALLTDLHRVQRLIGQLAARSGPGQARALNWVVLGSSVPGIFNLGGDLTLFCEKIRNSDREGLRRYAHSCIEVSYRNATGYDQNVVTIGLAQGDALGGGFESLLSCDVLIAERRSRFGLPEILFNLFPGMGAHCFLTRRLGAGAAERMIMSGKVYSAEEMHAAGVVDILAEDGAGDDVVRDYIRRNGPRHNAHAAIHQARRRVSPVSLEALRDVTDIWVDAAMELTEQDLRRMTHIVAAQDRSRRRTAPVGVAATP